MDLLLLLRVATLVLRLTLSSALAYLVVTRGGAFTPRLRTGWTAIAGVEIIFALGTGAIELVHLVEWIVGTEDLLGQAYVYFYHLLFLLNGLLDAWLPFVLVGVFAARESARHVCMVALVAVAGIGALAVSAGGLVDWTELLGFGQILSFCAIAGYLVFAALLLLGRLRSIDVFLASFIAVAALFQIVLPIQEAIFQVLGPQASSQIWGLHQFLQLARVAGQLAIVGAAIRATGRGIGIRPVPAGASALESTKVVQPRGRT